MRNTKLLLFLLLIFTATVSLFIISCDIKNPVEGLEVRVKNIPRTTTVRVEFIDAATNKQIGASADHTINVKFEGTNKNDIISTVNESVTQLSTKNGVLFFAIRDDLIPSASNPVSVLLIVTSQNYVSTSQRLDIVNKGISNYAVFMTSAQTNAQPSGVTLNEISNAGSVSSSSGTSSEISISSNKQHGTEPNVTLTIPAGTLLKDASGKALSGTVSARLVYFNPLDDEALAAFPGGFRVATDTRGEAVFITAGFTAIDLYVNGTEVKEFGNLAASLNMEIPSGVNNPLTGNNVGPGDKIPLWSYNDDNGTWKFEGEYTVTAKRSRSSNLQIEKKDISHLTWYNIDWDKTVECFYGHTFRLIGGNNCYGSIYFKIFLRGRVVQQGYVPYDRLIGLMRFPPEPVTVKFYLGRNGEEIGSVSIDNACADGETQVQLNDCTCLGIDVDVTIIATCPPKDNNDNPRIIDKGTIDVEIFRDGEWQLAGTIVDGFIQIKCLTIGQSYNFRVFYNGEYYSRTYTVTAASQIVEFQLRADNEFCK